MATEKQRRACAKHIERARELYEQHDDGHDIEIDSEPELSIADDAVWVQAWCRVPNSDVEG